MGGFVLYPSALRDTRQHDSPVHGDHLKQQDHQQEARKCEKATGFQWKSQTRKAEDCSQLEIGTEVKSSQLARLWEWPEQHYER